MPVFSNIYIEILSTGIVNKKKYGLVTFIADTLIAAGFKIPTACINVDTYVMVLKTVTFVEIVLTYINGGTTDYAEINSP